MKIKRVMLGLLLFLIVPLTAAAPQITVDRDLPVQAEKGQMVSVSLEMDVDESDPPPLVALKEFVPSGWEASNISHFGYFLSSAGEIRWALFAGDVVDSTITYNLHISQDASGEYTINGSIIIPEGTTLGDSKIMIPSQDISSSSSGGGGGGGSGTYALVKEILPGEPAKFVFPEGKAETAIIPEIELTANSKMYNTRITLELQRKNPTMIEPSGETYKWMSIKCSQPDRLIDEADITFKIEKQWLKDNDVDPDTVVMERQISGSELESLETTKTDSDDTHVTFSAKTEGFSYFAMSGEEGSGYIEGDKKIPSDLAAIMMSMPKKTKPPETAPPTPSDTPLPTSVPSAPEKGKPLMIMAAIAVILLVVAAFLLIKRKKI